MLANRRTLARISQNPGCTQQLNFFEIGKRLMLVDMPGYGFARVSKQQKKHWEELIRGYLCGRPNLKRVCLLLDARHEVKESDIQMMDMLDEAAVTYQLVLTKGDKVGQAPDLRALIGKHPAAYPDALLTSAETGVGIEDLREILAEFAADR